MIQAHDKLHLNYYCYFTDFDRFPNYEKTIQNLPKNSLIIFREYILDPIKRQELALKIQKIAKKHRHKLIIGKNFDLAKKIDADGYHFSDFDYKNAKNHALKLQNHQKINKNFIISLACHSLNSVKQAQKSNIDLLFFSPIFPTNSHPGAKTQGIFNLKKAKTASKIPIFALGGLNSSNLKQIRKIGVDGVAGIEIFQKN